MATFIKYDNPVNGVPCWVNLERIRTCESRPHFDYPPEANRESEKAHFVLNLGDGAKMVTIYDRAVMSQIEDFLAKNDKSEKDKLA